MKDPVKLAKKELPRFGAILIEENPFSACFDMPRGGRYWVRSDTPLPKVRRVIESTRERMNPLHGFTPADRVPVISGGVNVSRHFAERFALMEEQEQLTHDEVRAALEHPVRVYRRVSRFAFERGRVIVIVQVEGQHLVLISALWSSEELWARNPRPEQENDR